MAGGMEQAPSGDAQADSRAAADGQHVTLNVELPAEVATFTELHEVCFAKIHIIALHTQPHTDVSYILQLRIDPLC